MNPSLQERLAPTNGCFGCGPANEKGLRIRSFEQGETVVCDWTPEKHHEAFPNVLNGGICGTLLDCHGNWTAAWHLMQADKLAELPSTVTAEFHVKLKAPTPTSGPVHLTARVVERSGPRVVVEETLEAGGRVTATCRGVFVAVQPGHPAYHRW
jgi:acyl-coenzyme A thioesterase PaaI-like protein